MYLALHKVIDGTGTGVLTNKTNASGDRESTLSARRVSFELGSDGWAEDGGRLYSTSVGVT